MKKNAQVIQILKTWLRKAAAVLLAAMFMTTAVACAEDNMARVDFMANGGTGTTKQIVTDQVSNVQLTANAFTRDGYVFTGWNTEPDGSGTSYSNEALVKLALNNSLILYAQWKKDDGTETSSDNTETKKEDTTAAIADSGTVTAQKAEPTPTPTPTTSAAQKASSNISTANQSSSAVIKKKTWHDRVTLPIYEDRPIYENRPVYEQQPTYEDQPIYETRDVFKWKYSYSTATYSFDVERLPGSDIPMSQGGFQSEDEAKATADNYMGIIGKNWLANMFPSADYQTAGKLTYDIATAQDPTDNQWSFNCTDLKYTYTLPEKYFTAVTSEPIYDSEEDAKNAANDPMLTSVQTWFNSNADQFNKAGYTKAYNEALIECNITAEQVKTGTEQVVTGSVRVQTGTTQVQVGTESVQVGSEKVYVGDQVVQEEGWY